MKQGALCLIDAPLPVKISNITSLRTGDPLSMRTNISQFVEFHCDGWEKQVVAPSNDRDAKGLLLAALAYENPIILLEHR